MTLVNVWASWCVPCHDEAPLLDELAKDKRIQLAGINYKDSADNARRFLNRYGNPFVATGRDDNGRTSIDWGVYGVPETFIDRPRRPHRLQAGRADHRRQSQARRAAGNRKGAGAVASVVLGNPAGEQTAQQR